MKTKTRSILIGICLFLLALSLFAIYHGKKEMYYLTLNGVIVSVDDSSLQIQGDPQNDAGQRGKYIMKRNDSISIHDSSDDKINFSSLAAGDHVKVLYMDYIGKAKVEQYTLEDGAEIPNIQQIDIVE